MKRLLPYLFGVIMLLSAVGHLLAPEVYALMIPDFIPSQVANSLSAIAEGLIGILLFIPKYQSKGALLFALLMLVFLPVHIWDLMKENPAIGPEPAPTIRLFVQFLLIYAGWWLYKNHK